MSEDGGDGWQTVSLNLPPKVTPRAFARLADDDLAGVDADPDGQLDHGDAGHLGQERHGPRGARIRLDHVDLDLVPVDRRRAVVDAEVDAPHLDQAWTLLAKLDDALTVREAIRRLPPTQREVPTTVEVTEPETTTIPTTTGSRHTTSRAPTI